MKKISLKVSKTFPCTHPRKGEPTMFKEKILSGEKIHTIRGNYDYWKQKIDIVNAGEAVLVLEQWVDRPYWSKVEDFWYFDKDDDIGIQKVTFGALTIGDCTIENSVSMPIVDGIFVPPEMIAKNDGLYLEDFFSWFENYDLSKPQALIHFTGFRY